MQAIPSHVPAIEVTGLRKRYRKVEALAGLDMTVGQGEVFGFLGPNGAGKTTTVKLLLGLARPSGGAGRVLGKPLGDLATRQRVGYLPELFRYQPWMSAREVLLLHAELMGLERRGRGAAADDVIGLVGLGDRATDQVGRFSKGMQQRLGLAVALLGDPALVILDEPTSALDPLGRIDVRAIIREARHRGAGVFLNSHLLSEVEQVCDRVAIVDRGRVVAIGTLDDVLGASETQIHQTGLRSDQLDLLETYGRPTLDGDLLVISPMDPARVHQLIAQLVNLGVAVHDVRSGRGTLEQRFLELVARERPPIGTPLVAESPDADLNP